MLLGSIKFLSYRRKVKKELLEMGYKQVIIMEEFSEKNKRNLEYGSIDEKFEWIVKSLNPQLFVAIFHKNKKILKEKKKKRNLKNGNGVTFEIGWLCGRFGTKKIGKKLRFIFEQGYKKEKTAAYINALFNKIPRVEFNESKDYMKSSELIRTFISSLVTKK